MKNKKALAFCGDMGYNVSAREIVFFAGGESATDEKVPGVCAPGVLF